MNYLKKSFDFIASYGFACIIFVFLFVLTYLGTIEQVNVGLYEAQKKYFESMIVVHWLGPIPIVLPGVYLLLVLFTVNLIAGGIIPDADALALKQMGVRRVYTPKDYKITQIMGDVVKVVEETLTAAQ